METSEKNLPDDGAPKRRLNSSIVAAGVAFGITLAGLGVAAAQTDSSSDSTAAPTTTAAPSDSGTSAPSDSDSSGSTGPADRPARTAETLLTGDVADKVSAAALAAVPGGTIIRVETDSDGSPYEAHVRKADGTEVVVKVDDAFEVTGTEAGGGPGGPGRHGPRPGDGTEQETD